jgi:hemolysin activation/secretion protein
MPSVREPRLTAPRYVTGLMWLLVVCAGLSAQIRAAAAAPAPQAPAESRFDITEYRVLGNTVLAATDVERAVYEFLGSSKTLADVEAARTALEGAYRSNGYGTVFVDIPEQSVDEGIVRLKVTEGRLARTRIEGAQYFSGRRIRTALPAANANVVPNLPELQAQLAALNTETPDRVVLPVLKSGALPGTVDLTLNVEDHLPLHGSVEVNNQTTADTSELRTSAAASYDNLFDHLDSLSLQYQASPQEFREVGVFAASYTRRLHDDAQTRLAFMYIRSRSDVSTIGTLSVLGSGSIYGVRMIRPLQIIPGQFTLAADFKDFSEDIRLDAESGLQTAISYVNVSAGYVGRWATDARQLGVGFTANVGTRGLANRPAEFDNKRFKARPNYFYVRGNADLVEKLPLGFSLLARLTAQYSVEPLVSNEQLGIGGADGVRGYLEAEELGDLGAKVSLQLGSPQWKPAGGPLSLDAFAFADAARVSIVDHLPGEYPNTSLLSWGLGLNLALGNHVYGSLIWADPLRDATRTQAGESRLLFNVRSMW